MTPQLLLQNGHTQQVTAVAFAPDGTFVATGSTDQTIKLWEPRSGQLLAHIPGNQAQVTSLSFSPDGQLIASGGRDIKLWDVATGRLSRVLRPPEMGVDAVAFSPDGRLLAAVSERWDDQAQRHIGEILLWDLASGQVAAMLRGHTHEIKSLTFSPDGSRLASASWDKTVRLWDPRTHQPVATLAGHTKGLMAVAFSPDGRFLASAGWDRTARVWDAVTGKALRSMEVSGDGQFPDDGVIDSVAFSPDGKRLALGLSGFGKVVKLWDLTSDRVDRELKGAGHLVAFSPDGKWIAAGGYDHRLTVWDTAAWQRRVTADSLSKAIYALALSPDGRWMATASGDLANTSDRRIRLWELATGRVVAAHTDATTPMRAVAFHPQKGILAGVNSDPIKLWDVTEGRLRAVGEINAAVRSLMGATPMSFSPDGSRLAFVTIDYPDLKSGASLREEHTVQIWDAAARRRVAAMGDDEPANTLAYSPDGRLLATGSRSKGILLWDTRRNVVVGRFPKAEMPNAIAFSPDGALLVSGHNDWSVRLWEVRSTRLAATLKVDASIHAVAFSPDGTRLAAGGLDDAITIWDVATKKLQQTLEGHSGWVRSLAFTSNGDRLLSSSDDGTIRLWDPTSGTNLATLQPVDDQDWIAYTPSGQFDASPNGLQYVTWRVGSKVQAVASIGTQPSTPGLWAKLWTGHG